MNIKAINIVNSCKNTMNSTVAYKKVDFLDKSLDLLNNTNLQYASVPGSLSSLFIALGALALLRLIDINNNK